MGYHYLSIIRSMHMSLHVLRCALSDVTWPFELFCNVLPVRWNNKLTRKCWNFTLLSREDNNSVRRLSSIELVNRLRGSCFICFRIYLSSTELAKFLPRFRLRWRWWKIIIMNVTAKKNSQSRGQDECHAMQNMTHNLS